MDNGRRLLTKTQLRAEHLKPAPGQRPASRYWQGMGWVYLYDAAGAMPMRPYRAPSPAQRAALAAGRELVGPADGTECGARVFREDLRFGLCLDCQDAAQRQAEADEWADVCVEAAVQPLGPMSDEARAVNGITDAELAEAPDWPAVADRRGALLAGRVVIAHNADFDRRILRQTCAAHALDLPAAGTWAYTLDLLTAANGGTIAVPARVPRVIADDADDDHMLACPLAGNAELMLSGDKHLLRLGSEYQDIRILTPAEAVSIVGAD